MTKKNKIISFDFLNIVGSVLLFLVVQIVLGFTLINIDNYRIIIGDFPTLLFAIIILLFEIYFCFRGFRFFGDLFGCNGDCCD